MSWFIFLVSILLSWSKTLTSFISIVLITSWIHPLFILMQKRSQNLNELVLFSCSWPCNALPLYLQNNPGSLPCFLRLSTSRPPPLHTLLTHCMHAQESSVRQLNKLWTDSESLPKLSSVETLLLTFFVQIALSLLSNLSLTISS